VSTRRKTRWGTDSRGRYTRRIGWKRDESGKLVQPLFYLGSDLIQAKRREDRLAEFWQHIEGTYQGDDRPLWDSLTLAIGREIAKGKPRIVIERRGNSPESYARYLHRLRAAFPMMQIAPDEPEAYQDGAESAEAIAQGQIAELERQMAELQRKHARIGNIAPGNCGGMLHEALDAYVSHIKETAVEPGTDRLTDGACARVANAKRLRERHEDAPLSGMASFDAAQGMVNVWRNRPLVKNSNPPRAIRKKTAEHHIGELMRFFRWLARTDRFDWRKPEHFDEIGNKSAV